MKIRDQFLASFFYGLIFLSVWFLVEGFYLAWTVDDVPAWGAFFNLGVGMPLGFMGAIGAGLLAVCWGMWLGVPDATGMAARSMIQRLRGGALSERARRCAWLLGAPLLVGCWLGAGALMAPRVLSAVKTPAFVGLVILAIEAILAVALWLMAPVFLLAIRAVLLGLHGLLVRVTGRDLLRPGYVLVAMAGATAVMMAIFWGKYADILAVLPWGVVLGPLVGSLIVVGTGWLLHAKTRGLKLTSIGLGLSVFVLGVICLYLPQSLKGAREVVVGQSTVVSAWYGIMEPRMDFDDDGAISYYAGNDCAPNNPEIHPRKREIIGNGIDENCSGSDLVVNPEDFKSGTLNRPKPEGVVRKPNIILITTDALPAEHTTLGGYRRNTTPNLAKWAEKATVFKHGFSLGTSTRLALPGLFAGQFNSMVPMKNGRSHPYSVTSSTPTIASLLKKQGYHTVFVPGTYYFHKSRWPGVSKGFDTVDTKAVSLAPDKVHTSPTVTQRALHYLEEQPSEKPLFLWVHYFDHHHPYEKVDGHAPFKGDKQNDLYDNELHWADMHWGQVMRAVQKKWAPEEYMMVFTADHGERWLDSGKSGYHGRDIGTELLHVPLIIQGSSGRGQKHDDLVSHADIGPTLLNIVGVNAPDSWIGESLIPVLFDGEKVEKKRVFSLLYIPEDSKRQKDGFRNIGLRTQDFYYFENLRTGQRKLIDWQNDPHDKVDLSEKFPKTFEIYRYITSQQLNKLHANEKSLSHLNKKKKALRAKKAAHKKATHK